MRLNYRNGHFSERRLNQCQCEHEAHFKDAGMDHPYGIRRADYETALCYTAFGRFVLCENCREAEHMAPYREVRVLGERKVAS